MDKTSLHISLPTPLRAYVEGRVTRGGYSTPSEYVRALIREDQTRERKLAELREAVDIGVRAMERGEYDEYDERTIGRLSARIKAQGRKALEERTKRRPA